MEMTRRHLLVGTTALSIACVARAASAGESYAVTHTDAEWRKLLTADQFAVLDHEPSAATIRIRARFGSCKLFGICKAKYPPVFTEERSFGRRRR